MNANELADELESCGEYELVEFVRRNGVANFLRQQQAEIEALKKKIQNMALDLLSAHAQADDHWVELERLKKAKEK